MEERKKQLISPMEVLPEGDRAILEAYSLSRSADRPLPRGVLKESSRRAGGVKGGVKGIFNRTIGRHGDAAAPGSGNKVTRGGVRFTAETHPGIEAELALSITRHRIKDGRYVEYTIVVHQKGQDSIHPIQKRYKQFEALQRHMKRENKDYELPHLPGKRWFKANKWDDNYHIDRRFALQLYLRLLVKLYGKSSPTLRSFLDLRDEELLKDDDKRESQVKMLETMNKMNAMNKMNHQVQKIDADAAAVLEGIDLPPPPSSILQASTAEEEAEGPGVAAPPAAPSAQTSRGRATTDTNIMTTDTGITGDPWAESDRDESPVHIAGKLSPARGSNVSEEAREGEAVRVLSQCSDSDSECEGEGDEGSSCKMSVPMPIAGEGGANGAQAAENDYLQDSIASSFQLREKRLHSTNGLKDDEDNENIVAANLNLHLLLSAKQAESPFYGKAELEHQNERAHSTELFHPPPDEDSTGAEKGEAYRSFGGGDEDEDSDGWVDDFGGPKLGM